MATVPCPVYILCILTRVWHNSAKTHLQVKLHRQTRTHARYIMRVSHIPHIVLCWSNLAVHGMWPNSRTIWPVSVCQQAWVQCYILGSPIKTYCDVWIQVQYNNYYVYTMYPTLCDTCFIVVWQVRTLGCSWCKSHVCVVWYTFLLCCVSHACSVHSAEVAVSRHKGTDTIGLHVKESSHTAKWVMWNVCTKSVLISVFISIVQLHTGYHGNRYPWRHKSL